MVGPEPENENEILILCPECNNKISPEALEDNNDPNAVYCPFCGIGLSIETQIEETQEIIEQTHQIEITRPSPEQIAKKRLKLHVHFSIYDLLYGEGKTFAKIKKQKYLSSLTLKQHAKQLRSMLLKRYISRELVTKLSLQEQKILMQVFYRFKESLKDEKQFKEHLVQVFTEGIQFIFEVMRGDYEFADLSSPEKEIVMKLKDKVSPFNDIRNKRSPGRRISIILARIIHHYLFALSRTNEPLTPDAVKDLVDDYIEQLSSQESIEWIETRINIKLDKRDQYHFKIIRNHLNIDWVQRECFSDHLASSVKAVQALMLDETGKVANSGLSRTLMQGFKESELFRLDRAFTTNEKLNLTIILARMIHSLISTTFPPPKQINSRQKMPAALHREITTTILEGLVDHLEINSKILVGFYNFSSDKFHDAREKLFEKLEGDMIYRMSFRIFLVKLVNTVFMLTRQKPKESKLSPLELRIREDLELSYQDESKRNREKLEEKALTGSNEPLIGVSEQADESSDKNQLLTTRARSQMPSAIITRKFALIPEGDKLARSNTINNIREQFIKFRDLENIYSEFLVGLVKSDPSIVNNQPWEYPNFHLSITRAHRAEFNALKEKGKISQDEKLPTNGKVRIRKYFYDHFSDPSNPLRNLSRFNTNYRKREQFIERANQNALQYPYYAVRNWIVRNERLKTIAGTLIGFLNSQQGQKIHYRKQGIDKTVPSSSYMIEHFLEGKPIHREFLKQFSNDTKNDIFGQFDNPSHEYISGHVGQLRNIILDRGILEVAVRASISRVITQITQDPSISDALLEPILKKYPDIQQNFLKWHVRLARYRTTKRAKMRLKKGVPLQGTSFDVTFVNELFDAHDIKDLDRFKAMRDELISEESILQSKGYKELSLDEIKAKVLDHTIQFLNALIANPSLNASKVIFKPSYPKIGLTSFDFQGFTHYLSTKLFHEVKSRFYSLFILLGEADNIKKLLIDELRNVQTNIYDIIASPRFTKLAIPLVQPEYMYELDGTSRTARFGMIKMRGKEHFFRVSPKQKDRFNNVHIPDFKLTDKKYKDNLSNPVLKMEGRKLILCQPFKIKMDHATNSSRRESAPKIEVGVDLGIKHFAVLSVMDKTDTMHPIELQRYFLGQKSLHDLKFNDKTGHFERLTNQKHAANIKLKLIKLRQEHNNIQKKRAVYENRYPAIYHEKIKHYHRSKTESVLWNKIQEINSDIVARLSGLIVKIAKYHGAQIIRFEDLKWSRHQAKKEKGKFIAFWQVHWFHSQVQSMTAQNAIRCGIHAVMVDAFMTSQTCACCHKKGDRLKSNTKLFYCPHCKTTLDADLNAARNIAKRDTVKILQISHSPEYLCSVDGFQ